jgi:hypothetical protein
MKGEVKGLVKVELTTFGRPVPVELHYWQIEHVWLFGIRTMEAVRRWRVKAWRNHRKPVRGRNSAVGWSSLQSLPVRLPFSV